MRNHLCLAYERETIGTPVNLIALATVCAQELTPLLLLSPWQNNLKELFSLLHFVVPDFFDSMEAFTTFFDRPFASDDTGTVDPGSRLESLMLSGRFFRSLSSCQILNYSSISQP